MKKVMTAVVILAVIAIASSALAQFGSIKKGGGAVNDLKNGNVAGAVDKSVDIAIDAENKECKDKISSNKFHRNVEFNVKNGGPDKIKSVFGDCTVSNNSDTYWSAKCKYKNFNYVDVSCSTNNCSLYCYNNN